MQTRTRRRSSLTPLLCVGEIPKYTRHKMEISTKLEGNPLVQDTKKGKLRDYHGPLYWNYGMLPQTWEDPAHHHDQASVAAFGGDGDPLDALEISSGKPCEMGECVVVLSSFLLPPNPPFFLCLCSTISLWNQNLR